MPPRISRLQWPRLFPRHEPLLFLYPRWYAVEATTTATAVQHGHEQGRAGVKEQGKTDEQTQDEDSAGFLSGTRRHPPIARRKATHRQLQESKRQALRSKAFYSDDWRTPLALLRNHTRSDARYHIKQLERLNMPEGMLGYCAGDLNKLFLHVYLQTECHVQVARWGEVGEGSRRGGFEALELAGTKPSIERAKMMLGEGVMLRSGEDLNAKGKMRSYATTTEPVSRDESLPRSVWTVGGGRPRDVADISEPKRWTTVRFANHVHDLVTSEQPRSLHKLPRQSHVALVTEKLVALFTSPKSLRYSSSYACTLALQFLSHHHRIPDVRRILDAHQALRSATHMLTPNMFNVCLHSAAEARDLHSYNFLLRMMLDRNVEPDYKTWASLAYLVQARSEKDAKHVIAAMRQRNMLLHPGAKIAIANVTVKADFAQWLARGETIEDFIGHYDAIWQGKDWLDPRAANTILEPLVSRGEFAAAFNLLDTLIARGRQPNLVTLHIFLGAAIAHKHLDLAATALHRILPRFPRVRPDAETYTRLANLAFEKRAFNLLRVVWRHAAMSGHIGRAFRVKMQRCLLLPSLPAASTEASAPGTGIGTDALASSSRGAVFKALAAKIALGVSCTYTPASFTPTPLTVPGVNPTDATTPQQQTKHLDRESKLQPLNLDLQTAGLFTPVKALDQAVREAVSRDKEWGLWGWGKGMQLKVLLNEAVDVEIVKH